MKYLQGLLRLPLKDLWHQVREQKDRSAQVFPSIGNEGFTCYPWYSALGTTGLMYQYTGPLEPVSTHLGT